MPKLDVLSVTRCLMVVSGRRCFAPPPVRVRGRRFILRAKRAAQSSRRWSGSREPSEQDDGMSDALWLILTLALTLAFSWLMIRLARFA
jgi:hypothetical protein